VTKGELCSALGDGGRSCPMYFK